MFISFLKQSKLYHIWWDEPKGFLYLSWCLYSCIFQTLYQLHCIFNLGNRFRFFSLALSYFWWGFLIFLCVVFWLVGWFFKKNLQKRLRAKCRCSLWMSLMYCMVEKRYLASWCCMVTVCFIASAESPDLHHSVFLMSCDNIHVCSPDNFILFPIHVASLYVICCQLLPLGLLF